MTKSNINIDQPLEQKQIYTLDWSNKDIEQKIGINGGRFTRVNTFFHILFRYFTNFYFLRLTHLYFHSQ